MLFALKKYKIIAEFLFLNKYLNISLVFEIEKNFDDRIMFFPIERCGK